jgi:cell division protein FtsB
MKRMLKRIIVSLITIFSCTALFAQQDIDDKVKELQRQIDILTQEIESLKTPQTAKAAAADTPQYGLGAAASKVYRSQAGVSFGGYGEMLYQNRDKSREDTADLLRAVLYTGYKFNDKILFNSELEVEHASTESGGAVSMEFAYLDFLRTPALNYRAGVVLVPMGFINEQHEPTAYLGARRPAVERVIIPATWGEIGAGIFGDVSSVSYRAYLVTGLNAAHFDSEEGIREGRQAGAEALANDFAVVGRADWHPFEGTLLGGSVYSGNSGQTADFSGRVTIGEVHGDAKFRGLSLRALYARGTIGDAARINDANLLAGDESVGKTFGGWYGEAGYNVNRWLTPYVRYEQLDTQRSVPAGFSRNLANDQKIFTVGAAFRPITQTVIKIDYQNLNNKAHTGTKQWNVAVGYIF